MSSHGVPPSGDDHAAQEVGPNNMANNGDGSEDASGAAETATARRRTVQTPARYRQDDNPPTHGGSRRAVRRRLNAPDDAVDTTSEPEAVARRRVRRPAASGIASEPIVISFTISLLTGDVTPTTWHSAITYIKECPHIPKAAFALERGLTMTHLHIQGVMTAFFSTPSECTARIYDGIFHGAPQTGDHVVCKTVHGRDGYTYTFMLGYVQKDRSRPHFRLTTKNVTEEELQYGMVEYGARASNKAVPLITRSNIFEKIRLFLRLERGPLGAITKYMDRNARPADALCVHDVLLIMVRSARFTPSGEWISFGGYLSAPRSDAMLRIVLNPKQAARDDVRCVFFGIEATMDAPSAPSRAPSPPPPDEDIAETYGERWVRLEIALTTAEQDARYATGAGGSDAGEGSEGLVVGAHSPGQTTPDDPNDDNCFLCGLTGVPPNAQLVCCDSCPAAWHMKCLPQNYEGTSASQLPDNWQCPMCDDRNAFGLSHGSDNPTPPSDSYNENQDIAGEQNANDIDEDAAET